MLVPKWIFENGHFIGIKWVKPEDSKTTQQLSDQNEPDFDIKKAS